MLILSLNTEEYRRLPLANDCSLFWFTHEHVKTAPCSGIDREKKTQKLTMMQAWEPARFLGSDPNCRKVRNRKKKLLYQKKPMFNLKLTQILF